MSLNWTTEQVISLSPDASSTKNGQKLANLKNWVTLGQNQTAIWGECQGSGKNPYRTQIDLSEPAFKCSCPSRKFPCKHALGLFLIFVSNTENFPNSNAPDWVQSWLENRQQRQQQKETKTKIVDPVAQAKRIAQKETKIQAGIAELDLWLRDLIRQGLVNLQSQSYNFWETIAARMIDAQAPGLARKLRKMSGIAYSGEGWQEKILTELGLLYLIIEAYQHLDSLEPNLQADVKTLVGWTIKQEELLADPSAETIKDYWLVVGKKVEQEDKLTIQRTWLWGENTKRAALILDFAVNNQPLDVSLVTGTCFEAELVFYQSNYPLRAVIKNRQTDIKSIQNLTGYATINDGINNYTYALSKNPWLAEFPCLLSQVIPAYNQQQWFIIDTQKNCLKINPKFNQSWQLLALSGGHPLNIFGEWTGIDFLPLSVSKGSQFYSF